MRALRVFGLLSLLGAPASAQCIHEVQGFDSFGDGWNGASLDVAVNGAPALSNFSVAVTSSFAGFFAGTGDTISTVWTNGAFDNEAAYSLFGGDGGSPPVSCSFLASEGPFPTGLAGVAGSCVAGSVPCPSSGSLVPANDDCGNAIPIVNGTILGTLVGATNDDPDASCGGSATSPDVWYSYQAPSSGTLLIDTCGSDGLPLGADTVLSVHDACGGTELLCNDDDPGLVCGGTTDSALAVPVSAGVTYLIRVSVFGIQGLPEFQLTTDLGAPTTFLNACNGDGGDQLGCTDCPCGNNVSPGFPSGCSNSSGVGGQILGSGSFSVTLGDLRFVAAGLVPGSFAVLLSGDALAPQNMANPCFGSNNGVQSNVLDGLRCAVQGAFRHGGRPVAPDGSIGQSTNGWGPPNGPPGGIADQGGFVPGQTRWFQAYYRELPGLSCGTEQNTSQSLGVTFGP